MKNAAYAPGSASSGAMAGAAEPPEWTVHSSNSVATAFRKPKHHHGVASYAASSRAADAQHTAAMADRRGTSPAWAAKRAPSASVPPSASGYTSARAITPRSVL